MVEYIDIVDDSNEVIGAKEREEVHAKGLLHRSVHIFIFNSNEELFLQKRSQNKNEHPGKYDSSAAGHLDAGEGYYSAANRELFEELGIKVQLKLEFSLDASYETDNEFVNFYTATYDDEITINSDEIEEGVFFTTKNINEMINTDPESFTPVFRLLFNKYLLHKGD